MKLKLSDAIRLGSMLRPQCFGLMFKNGGSCAIGAACEAVGLSSEDGMESFWDNNVQPFKCPMYADYSNVLSDHCMGSRNTINQMIVHLNDTHHWTRERIADWVSTVEPSAVEHPELVLKELELVTV